MNFKDYSEYERWQKWQAIKEYVAGFIVLTAMLVAAFFVIFVPAKAHAYSDEQIVKAIYKAEGGKNAQYPYGIRSVKCRGERECFKVCLRTVRNNRIRFKHDGGRRFNSFIEMLASRFCPVGAGNDPKNLNQNWLKNVTYFLRRDNA